VTISWYITRSSRG